MGTVGGINHDENLVVFHGGGVYPDNWDVQLKPHGQKFSVGHTYRVIFRLTHLRDEPLAGYSFRGVVLCRTSDDPGNSGTSTSVLGKFGVTQPLLSYTGGQGGSRPSLTSDAVQKVAALHSDNPEFSGTTPDLFSSF